MFFLLIYDSKENQENIFEIGFWCKKIREIKKKTFLS